MLKYTTAGCDWIILLLDSRMICMQIWIEICADSELNDQIYIVLYIRVDR